MALTADFDFAPTGGYYRRLPSEISANPFIGSLLSYAADGFVHELVAGEPFAGIARGSIGTCAVATADGSRFIDAHAGVMVIMGVIAGVAQVDAERRRKVFASDDGTLTFTAAGNTLIGTVVGVEGSKAIILAETAEFVPAANPHGVVVLADAIATLTTAQLDKLLIMTPTAGRTLTLPPAAQATGRGYTITTLGAFAITLDGDAAELVNAAATFAGGATVGSVLRVMSTGTAWVNF